MTLLPHPVPEAARVELERLGARWRTLPLAQALAHAPALRALAQAYADECTGGAGDGDGAGTAGADDAGPAGADDAGTPGASGTPGAARLPDLGPATAYNQLRTLTYDVAQRRDDAGRETLAAELAELRRRIG